MSGRWGAVLAGAATAGLLDGILLHRILGWHHLLSARIPDARANELADGLFDLAMLALLLSGVAMLAREHLPGRVLAGLALVGAGVFHMFDTVVFHLLLGLHHIHPAHAAFADTAFAVVGAAFLLAGSAMLRAEARRLQDHLAA
jgi:uncharacterized membrane protein